jgi:hypothetical protein
MSVLNREKELTPMVAKTELAKAQAMMVEDGFPPSLFKTREERAAWWDAHPPKAMGIFDDARMRKERELREQVKEEATKVRIAKLLAGQAKKKQGKIDLTGKRWDSVRNRFVDEIPIRKTQDAIMAKSWKVTPFDGDGAPITKGCLKIEEGTLQVEILTKMGEAFHRCPEGSVKKIIVTDAADGIIREWEEGGAELPKPEAPAEEEETLEQVAKKAAKKGAKRGVKEVAAKKKGKAAKPAAKSGGKAAPKTNGAGRGSATPGRGPGVIATIVETIQRPKGASVDEILEVLVKKFPDRKPASMTATIRIQANRNCKSKDKDEKRGLVYFGK